MTGRLRSYAATVNALPQSEDREPAGAPDLQPFLLGAGRPTAAVQGSSRARAGLDVQGMNGIAGVKHAHGGTRIATSQEQQPNLTRPEHGAGGD